MAPTSGKKRAAIRSSGEEDGIVARFSRSVSDSRITGATGRFVAEATDVSKKLLRSTGRAAWIAGTTFLILVVPLIIEMDRDQQLTDMELQQQSLLGATSVAPLK